MLYLRGFKKKKKKNILKSKNSLKTEIFAILVHFHKNRILDKLFYQEYS